MEVGDFGRARFPQEKKGFIGGIDTYGRIKAIEKKFVLFEDNDGYIYLVERENFGFTECEFKSKIK